MPNSSIVKRANLFLGKLFGRKDSPISDAETLSAERPGYPTAQFACIGIKGMIHDCSCILISTGLIIKNRLVKIAGLLFIHYRHQIFLFKIRFNLLKLTRSGMLKETSFNMMQQDVKQFSLLLSVSFALSSARFGRPCTLQRA